MSKRWTVLSQLHSPFLYRFFCSVDFSFILNCNNETEMQILKEGGVLLLFDQLGEVGKPMCNYHAGMVLLSLGKFRNSLGIKQVGVSCSDFPPFLDIISFHL